MRKIFNMLQSFGSNSKNRVLLFIVLTMIAVIAVGSAYYLRHLHNDNIATVSVSGAPDIASLPGVGKSSNAYIISQNNQNNQNEMKAKKDFGSSVPTITRPNFKGSLSQFYSDSAKGQCPLKGKLQHFNRDPSACTLHNLKLAKQAGVTAEELACQGCSCPVIREAGYSSSNLKSVGYSAAQLRACGFTLQQLIAAGFSPKELKDAGYTASQLKQAGYTSAQLKAAGFSAAQLKKAGFTAAQLKAAGFTAAQLKKTGFTAAQLKAAGFTAAQLKAAGVTDKELNEAGFTPNEIAEADGKGSSTSTICNVNALKKEKSEGYSAKQLRAKGCGLAALKSAGFSAKDLKAAGFSAAQLKAAGFSAAQLKAAGFTAKQLKKAGFTAAQLKAAGFTAKQLKNAGFTAAQLKAAGFTAKQLKKAGFTAAQLKKAGFNAAQLHAAGFSAADLAKAGFNAKQLANAGFTAAQLKAAGFSPRELSKAGFTKGDLLRAGFTPAQAGFASTANHQGSQVGVNPKQSLANNSGLQPLDSSSMPSLDANSAEAQMARLNRMQQQQMTMQQHEDEVAQMQSSMSSMSQKLLAGWSSGGQQKLTSNPQKNMSDQSAVHCQLINGEKYCASGVSVASSGGYGLNASGSLSGGPIMKAGSIMFAVLQTSIDSDDVGTPIMAKIVTGRLKGGKLIGKFTRINTHLVMQFNILSMPNYPKSIPISSFGIDPDTARTALSGSVNEHYMQRYGTLFASSFLEGIGDAFQSANNTMHAWKIGGMSIPVVVKNPPNATQAALIGLGKVGSRVGQDMGDIVNRPPTVKLQSGTGVGILIMSDLQLPENKNSTSANEK